MTIEQAVEKLNAMEKVLYAVGHSMSVLCTDGDTAAPKQSWKGRGEALGYLGELQYRQMNDPETPEVLQTILDNRDGVAEKTFRQAEELKERYDDMHLLTVEEYVAYEQLINEANAVWHDAKEKSDFPAFAPYLEKITAHLRRLAKLKKPDAPAYDTLLDMYEKGVGMAELDPFFRTLRGELSPLIAEVAAHPLEKPAFMKEIYPAELQRRFSEKIMRLEGLDPERCTIAETEHPFTSGPNKWDVRITTRYEESDFTSSLYSVIHEGGHALYELGVRDDLQFTSLSGGSTMGLHESQSRFYENLIGRSRAFCRPLLAALKEVFPAQMEDTDEETLYRGVNLAGPSLIRTEADELTYSLHVLIRYELEKALIGGELEVKDLPGEWNRMYREILGVEVPDDRRGVLQDSHWSGGAMGYFPSYALGSAYGVQMLRRMEETVDVWGEVEKGNLAPVTAWLGERIHQYGRLKKPAELLLNAMGGPLDARVYTDYLKKKFTGLYRL